MTLCIDCHNNESASTGEFRNEWIQYCQERVQEIYARMSEERRIELQRLRTDLEARI
ncbi:hypothetical protein J4429_04765 [Candidatus Pacearchaeota archaeon]|nr:hypothetical protein [Candidatus Pacearchaeota archaeon]